MRVLIVGAGGREHALAWKVAQSPRLTRLFVAPGNAGTAGLGERVENVPIRADDGAGLVVFAREQHIDLAIIGPEGPLAAGLADELNAAGVPAFGPSRAAAQIESSKSFAKAFMQRHGLPTPAYTVCDSFEAALAYARVAAFPIVIKASGLAAGKGVILPESAAETEGALRRIMLDGEFGAAGVQVVIEERLSGPEVSLLGFCDGLTARRMPPAQDHKNLLDGDRGPNTGGMGAYAPAPICPPALADELAQTILQRAVDGLRAEGSPFVGVLYAGLMLTPAGPRVLEFNCRFGDPETQAILPLLETDLLDIAQACVEGRLAEPDIRWKAGAAACVMLASEGYPGKSPLGRSIRGLDVPLKEGIVFHSGTRREPGSDQVVTDGGRVLGVTGWGSTLPEALSHAYDAVEHISFEGQQYRRDIGHRALDASLPWPPSPGREGQGRGQERGEPDRSQYARSGVSIDAGNRALALMSAAVRSTYGPEVLAGLGAFGGQFDAAALKAMRAPVLVASTDGIGTKLRLAAAAGRCEGLGHDIVNHCINDILVQGARPLFFLDYIATDCLEPERVAELVTGMAAACRAAGCALLGGETAEMPGVYNPGEFDVAGTIVGVAERAELLPRPGLQTGDVLIGLRSSGPHTNGYSLIRRAVADISLDAVLPEIGQTLVDALLAPHRSYLSVISPGGLIKALAHITGGGFFENIPRVLPDGLCAVIRRESWPVPPLFRLIQERGHVPEDEMYRVFNMGIGMVAVAGAGDAAAVQAAIAEDTWVIGELAAGERGVILA